MRSPGSGNRDNVTNSVHNERGEVGSYGLERQLEDHEATPGVDNEQPDQDLQDHHHDAPLEANGPGAGDPGHHAHEAYEGQDELVDEGGEAAAPEPGDGQVRDDVVEPRTRVSSG